MSPGVRQDFPILRQKVHGKPLVYFDNGATSQKPQAVIDALTHYYRAENSNIHRGVHYLSEQATAAYEAARGKGARLYQCASGPRDYLRARHHRGDQSGRAELRPGVFCKAGDEIIVSAMEHHSNIVPWQMLCEQVGAKLRVIPINHDGEIVMEEYRRLLNDRTKFVSITHVSNALGTIVPVKEIVALAHERGVPVLLDGAQAVPHLQSRRAGSRLRFLRLFRSQDVWADRRRACLYGRAELLEKMPPYQGGGDMISLVTFEKTHYNVLPYKFEAGTPHIAGGIGSGRGDRLFARARLAGRWRPMNIDLLDYATAALSSKFDGLRIIGTAKEKAGVLSFVFDHVHAHDVGTILDQEGVAVRAGHHCAMPVMQRFGVPATTRASFAFYNTIEEIDVLVRAIERVLKVFG